MYSYAQKCQNQESTTPALEQEQGAEGKLYVKNILYNQVRKKIFSGVELRIRSLLDESGLQHVPPV